MGLTKYYNATRIVIKEVEKTYQSSFVSDLTLPSLHSLGTTPEAGKRVKRAVPGYPSSIYYSLWLPSDWDNISANGKWRCMFDLPGNQFGIYTGLPDDNPLGYGLCAGQYVVVSCPFINTAADAITQTWWGDGDYTDSPIQTVDLQLAIYNDIVQNFNVNPQHIDVCGFSRGSIAVHSVSHYTNQISQLWKGSICYAHMDAGMWETSGANGSYYRLARNGNKKCIVCVGANDTQVTKDSCTDGHSQLKAFGYPVYPDSAPLEITGYGHDPAWSLLGNNAQTVQIREEIFNF